MAMKVRNNGSTTLTLRALNDNSSKLSKQLKKVSSGMKIIGAGDGASEYAISERMRVRIRALGQDEQNVQKGIQLLNVAEGAIQNQLDLLCTIKQRVIDADNDTNTEEDRATIQKEVGQFFDELENITYSTEYNGKKLLFGGEVDHVVSTWEVLPVAQPVDDTDMAIIPDNESVLDGVTGPFDIFQEYSVTSSTIGSLGLAASQNFSGGVDGDPKIFEMDFSGYANAASLNHIGFTIDGTKYVFTTNTSENYSGWYSYYDQKIDISGCTTVADALNRLNGVTGTGYNSPHRRVSFSASGTTLTVTTGADYYGVKDSSANNTTATGLTLSGGSTSYSGSPGRAAVSGTGVFTPSRNLSGGTNQIGSPGSTDPDARYIPGTAASLTANISGVAANTGISLYGSGYGTAYLKFVSGSSGVTLGSDGVYTVGLSATVSNYSIAGMRLSLSNGTLTLTSASTGTYGNSSRVSDGIPAVSATSSGTIIYTSVNPYNGTVTTTQTATDGTRATYELDLSSYNNTNSASLETLISDMVGKSITVSHPSYPYTGSSTYEFVDSGDPTSMDNIQKINGSTLIDLNNLRSTVRGGTTIKDAVTSLLTSRISNASSSTDGVLFTSTSPGSLGNSSNIIVREGTMRSYTIDFDAWLSTHSMSEIVGKGFRAYCATDADQWFNFLFTDGNPINKEKPDSGTATEDIKTLLIDVTGVRNASELVQRIYEETMPILTGDNPEYNHHMRVAADTKNGTLTLYDQRKFDVNTAAYDYQERGAKIADGIYDNVIRVDRDVLKNDIVIHHTDKASQNIHISIPRTTLDHLFNFMPGNYRASDFNVLTKSMRDDLLGKTPAQKGYLDTGIDYLMDAMTLIGAQQDRLQETRSVIMTNAENTESAESTIRDADMAKEMVDFVKSNILSQSAQSMLAMANQSTSSVLSLLQ